MDTRILLLAALVPLAAACGSGDGGGEDSTGPSNTPPSAEIEAPSEDTTADEGDEFTLQGSANDAEDGTLTGSTLEWSSDVAGDLGTGQTVTTALSEDTTHTVTLTATDSDGASDEASVEITVAEDTAGGVAAFAANASPNRIWLNDGSAEFTRSTQSLGDATSNGVAVGDLNGDNFLDMVVANDGPNAVWENQGVHPAPPVAAKGVEFGNATSNDVAIGDLNGDNYLDVCVANHGDNRIWLNDGSGAFDGAYIGYGAIEASNALAVGDLNGDNRLDLVIANDGPNTVWWNVGERSGSILADTDQRLGSATSNGVALGDLNGDNYLDMVVANDGPNAVWENQGVHPAPPTAAKGVELGNATSNDVAIGDLNGDNFLDAFVANDGPNAVWLGDGSGGFTSAAELGDASSEGVRIGDLNGDNFLDAFVANDGSNRVWLGDGEGGFTDAGQALGDATTRDAALFLEPGLVDNTSPTATITAPGPDSTFAPGELITFQGEASDAEDSSIPDAAFQWVSDRDGFLGSGRSIEDSLSSGTHQVLLSVADSRGATGTATVEVTVPLEDVTGTYEGTWTTVINDLDEEGKLTGTCPGSVTISEQNQGSISGSLEIEAGGVCSSNLTEAFDGSVQSDGTVTFGSEFQFSQFFGCEFLSGDQQFEGMVSGETLEADATGEYDCSDETGETDRTELTLGFEGS